jgi:pimeloyl-ACP methyl ester carboxylesterase
MPNAKLNGIDLYYEVHAPSTLSDSSTPLMLVAGLASDSQSWLPVLAPLAETRTVIIFDNRGCGRTTPQDAVSSIHQMAEDCIALADHLGVDRFDLLGHSMGGLIALDCALHHSARIGRLALVNSAAANSPRNESLFADWCDALRLGQDAEHWFRNFFYWILTPRFFEQRAQVDEFLRLVVDYPYPQTVAGFAAQVEAMRGCDFGEALPRISAQTLVLCSAQDAIFPPGDDAAGLARLSRSRVVVVPAAAHALHVEVPALFLEHVLPFLA